MGPTRVSHPNLIVVYLLLLILLVTLFQEFQRGVDRAILNDHDENLKTVIVASQKHENTSWLFEQLLDWSHHIYVVDDSISGRTVPKNKGHEAIVYLSYIIDNYESLPEHMFFIHAARYQWHNDDPDYDSVTILKNFQLEYLKESGYLNLRCTWALGCPADITPVIDSSNPDRPKDDARRYYLAAFNAWFPGRVVPPLLGGPCCAQFAVTREAVLTQSKEVYERIRQWLIDTDLEDAISGRLLEWSWHIIFGKEPVTCPSTKDCYCRMFGLCDLKCTDGSCDGRYSQPPYSTMPEGWPNVGWDGKPRTPGDAG